jgi:hypothetical protein
LAQLILFLRCVSTYGSSPGVIEAVPDILESVMGNLTELVNTERLVNETDLSTISLVVQVTALNITFHVVS